MQQSHAARSVWKTIAYMFRYMRDGKKLYILGVALMLVDAICQMLVPLAFGAVINALEADAAHFLNQQLWPSIGLATALIIVFAAVAYLGHTSVLYALSRLARNARVELFQHIQSLSANFSNAIA